MMSKESVPEKLTLSLFGAYNWWVSYSTETGRCKEKFEGQESETSHTWGFVNAPFYYDFGCVLKLRKTKQEIVAIFKIFDRVYIQIGRDRFVLVDCDISLRRSLLNPWKKVFSVSKDGKRICSEKYVSPPLRGLWDPDYMGEMDDMDDFFYLVNWHWKWQREEAEA